MFWGHVDRHITAYIHKELSPESAERVQRHLASCPRCRELYEQMRFAASAVRRLPHRSAPDSVWERIEARIVAQNPEEAASRMPTGLRWQVVVGGAAVLLIALLVASPLIFKSTVPPLGTEGRRVAIVPKGRGSFQVAALKGAPMIGGRELKGKGRMAAGEWLETNSTSHARVTIANIGQADVKPNSRLSLVNSVPNEHKLHLERGELHAKVNAPPRLFMVETASATAVDLGCEYTLKALPDGSSLLHVISGWVAMEIAGRASHVPAMMSCVTKPGIAPGTPYHQNAHPQLVDALKKFDFAGGGSAEIDTVLNFARTRDSLTLWHLLQRVQPQDKKRVYQALHRLVPAPKTATLAVIEAGNQSALDDWKNDIELTIYPVQAFSFGNLAVNVMRLNKNVAQPKNKGVKQ